MKMEKEEEEEEEEAEEEEEEEDEMRMTDAKIAKMVSSTADAKRKGFKIKVNFESVAV